MLTTRERPEQTRAEPRLLSKILRIEWLGQTLASGCWICSVAAYGINAIGDWLQLLAASAWLVANIAALGGIESAISPHAEDA